MESPGAPLLDLHPAGPRAQLQCRAAAAARAPWAGKVITKLREACAQRGKPQRPPQGLHCTPLPGLVAGQATSRSPGGGTPLAPRAPRQNRRDALPLQPRRLGAGLGGGIDQQPLVRCQTEGGLIGDS